MAVAPSGVRVYRVEFFDENPARQEWQYLIVTTNREEAEKTFQSALKDHREVRIETTFSGMRRAET